MSSRDRMPAAKEVVANFAVAGVLAVGAALASSATAAAEPPADVPADPAGTAPPAAAKAPPPSTVGAPLAQVGAASDGPAGLPAVPDLSGNTPNEYLLPQSPVPSAPGGPPGTPPRLNAFNNSYLLPQTLKPSAPGKGTVYDVAPGEENADIAGIDWLKRMHHMHVDGYLNGGLLGQMPQSQLGEPLPGTAPPPGAAIPPGLGQNLPDLPPPA